MREILGGDTFENLTVPPDLLSLPRLRHAVSLGLTNGSRMAELFARVLTAGAEVSLRCYLKTPPWKRD